MLPVIESYLQVGHDGLTRLFQGSGGLGRVAVYRIIDKYAQEAESILVPGSTPSVCQELIKQGTDLSVVAELAGYRSLNHLRRLQNSVKAGNRT